jgi:hypothetical protein
MGRRKSVPGGCGQNFLFCTPRKTSNRSTSCERQKKGSFRTPEELEIDLFSAAFGVWRKYDQAAVDGEGFELDAEAETFLMGEGCADLGPAFAGFAVAFVLLDGEARGSLLPFRAAVNPSLDAARKTSLFCRPRKISNDALGDKNRDRPDRIEHSEDL